MNLNVSTTNSISEFWHREKQKIVKSHKSRFTDLNSVNEMDIYLTFIDGEQNENHISALQNKLNYCITVAEIVAERLIIQAHKEFAISAFEVEMDILMDFAANCGCKTISWNYGR